MSHLRNVLSLSLLASLMSGAAFGQAGLPSKLPPMPKWQEADLINKDAPKAPAAAPAAESASAAPAMPVAGKEAPKPEPKTFVSDGAPFAMDELGFNIAPPQGWEVNTYSGSLSLVMREPKDETPSYDKPKYQRNITMAVKSNGSPIDEKRAKELEAELTNGFGHDGSVANFQIMEHKFFNFRGENDGLLVYSAMDLGEYHMMQMHVLVSGEENQFLMTYTDLADRFSDAQDPAFAKAWSSIVSVGLKGETPLRANEMIRYGALGGGAFMLLLVALLIRRKNGKKDYSSQADAFDDGDAGMNGSTSLDGSMIATLAQGWKISKKSKVDANDGLMFSSHAGQPIAKTKQTEFVSGF